MVNFKREANKVWEAFWLPRKSCPQGQRLLLEWGQMFTEQLPKTTQGPMSTIWTIWTQLMKPTCGSTSHHTCLRVCCQSIFQKFETQLVWGGWTTLNLRVFYRSPHKTSKLQWPNTHSKTGKAPQKKGQAPHLPLTTIDHVNCVTTKKCKKKTIKGKRAQSKHGLSENICWCQHGHGHSQL